MDRALTGLYVLEPVDLPKVALFDETIPRGDVRANRPYVVYDVQTGLSEDLLDTELSDLVLYRDAVFSFHRFLSRWNLFLQEGVLGAPTEVSAVKEAGHPFDRGQPCAHVVAALACNMSGRTDLLGRDWRQIGAGVCS